MRYPNLTKITGRVEDEKRFVCCVRIALELAYCRTGSGLGQAGCTAGWRAGSEAIVVTRAIVLALVPPFHLGPEVVSLAGMLTRNGDTWW